LIDFSKSDGVGLTALLSEIARPIATQFLATC
jgi:hypothetical protein